MNLGVLSFILLISLGFLFVGYLIRFDKRSNYSFMTGFALVMVAGLFMLATPVSFKSGETTTVTYAVNSTTDNTQVAVYDYTPLPSYQNNLIAMFLILGGLWGVIASVLKVKNWDESENIDE